jgi:fluoroacetyl-CoA thioesterase
VRAHDGVDLISKGKHERFVVAWDRFDARLKEKQRAHAEQQTA